MGRLEEKVAVITGGAKGIGYVTSKTFSKEGAAIVIVDMDKEAAEKAAQEICKEGGRAVAVVADLTEQKDRENIFEKAVEEFGKVDILINNAGWGCKLPFLETDFASFDRSVNLNMKATYDTAGLQADDQAGQRRKNRQHVLHGGFSGRTQRFDLCCHQGRYHSFFKSDSSRNGRIRNKYKLRCAGIH